MSSTGSGACPFHGNGRPVMIETDARCICPWTPSMRLNQPATITRLFARVGDQVAHVVVGGGVPRAHREATADVVELGQAHVAAATDTWVNEPPM